MDDVITGLSAAILEEVKLNGMSCAINGQPLRLESDTKTMENEACGCRVSEMV